VSRPHPTPSACTVLLVALLLAGCGPGATATRPASFGTSAAATISILAWTPPPGLAPTGQTEAGTVVRVVDGDTIIVRLRGRDERVRYIGMDTPESVKPDSPVEPFGKEAAAENRRLVAGRTVTLERDVSDRDQYGRLLRHVWLGPDQAPDGRWLLVGLELVRLGYAQAYTYPPDVKYADLILAAQRAAREAGLGLWSSPNP
jgi:micrococcal nuclease